VAGLEGTTLGPYEIVALLGAGGMGQVYRARDPRLERDVAIKVLTEALSKEPGYLERFQREARAVAKLNHPNIVPVYDFGEQGNFTYLVMPLIPGGTLRDYLAQRRRLPLAEAISITDQVASALQYAHERGLVHRDVKPANILLSPEGRALLSDFGIVRLVEKGDASGATLTHLGTFVGSPEYAAPEMVTGAAVDLRVDLYALGVVLFQLLTGQLPFSGATPMALLMMQTQQPPPAPRSLNPEIPPAVEAVVLKLLAKRPEDRYQTAAEVVAALRAAITTPTLETRLGQLPPTAIGDLPTVATNGLQMPGSGPAGYAPGGPGSGPPPVWVGPGSAPSGYTVPGSGPAGYAMPGSGPAGWPTPGSGPAGYAAPGSGPASWANQGSGPAGWASPGSGPAASPPLPQTYMTGLSVLPNQAPAPLPPAPARPRRLSVVLLVVLAFVLVVGGGATLALAASAGLFNKGNTPPQTRTTPGLTATVQPTKTPTITEFLVPTANSGPTAIATGQDGALWFTEGRGNQIGRLLPGSPITEYPTNTANPGYGQGITKGPDGNIWFTEPVSADNWIGRITPTGALTNYDIPTANSGTVGITTGPDDALWFAESDGGKIGRITTDGNVTEYPAPNGSRPFYIVKGPDNNLWFTDPGTNSIGRMTPQGNFIEYPIPTARSSPSGITVGPDNNLWFTENGGSAVGRINPSTGTIKEFPIPTADSLPVGITAGPDGNLWFTENKGNKIGRITTDGVITEFPLPTPNSGPSGITAGPGGALWFAEAGKDAIGRITS